MTADIRYPLQVALELHEFGRAMRAQRHRREHPDASEAEVATVVQGWLQARPGAEFGDSVGVRVTRTWPG